MRVVTMIIMSAAAAYSSQLGAMLFVYGRFDDGVARSRLSAAEINRSTAQ